MTKKTVRGVLVVVAGLWFATVWALSVGAVEPDDPQVFRTHCPVDDDDVCEDLGFTHSPSPSPSGSRTPSPSPSRSSSSSPSGSSSPSPSGSSSPSPSQTTPPPPSIQSYDSQISIKYARGAFKGRVRSESARCEPRRRVVLKKVKSGKDATVGRDRTNAKGGWKISKGRARGRYYAKVTRKQMDGRNNRTIRCNAARSRTIRP